MYSSLRNFMFLFCFLVLNSRAQCTYSCDTYHASEIPFSMYPADGDTLVMLDDQITTNMPIGFNFDFYCTTYNQLRICSNGFLTFDFNFISAANTPYAQNLPSTITPNGVIAWNWNDLDPSQGGTITYTTAGTSPNQVFILTYSNVPLWTPQNPPSPLRNTGQIVLHEGTHLIEIHVKEANNNGWLYHTEGIEDPTATKGVSIAGRNLALWTASLSSHLFSPYSTGTPPQISGDTIFCQGTPASFITTTLSNASGYQWSFPPGWTSNGTQQSSITAISGAAGAVSVAAIYTCGNSPAATLAVNVVQSPTVSLASAAPSVICSGSAFTIVPAGASFYTLEPGSLPGTSFVTYPSSSSVFTLSGYSTVSGCYAVNTATVFVSVKPSPSISVNSGTICKGSSFTMLPSGASQYTYSSTFATVTPPSAGVYSYSVWTTGSNGCVSAPAISIVSVAPLPVITITPTRSLICLGESTTLLAQGALTYTWTGLPGNSNTVSVSPPFNMVYSVIGKDGNGCTNYGNGSLSVDKCLSVAETGGRPPEFYPNPGKGAVYCNVNSGGSYKMYSQLGELLHEGELVPGLNSIFLPVTGILYFVVTEGPHQKRFRIISQ